MAIAVNGWENILCFKSHYLRKVGVVVFCQHLRNAGVPKTMRITNSRPFLCDRMWLGNRLVTCRSETSKLYVDRRTTCSPRRKGDRAPAKVVPTIVRHHTSIRKCLPSVIARTGSRRTPGRQMYETKHSSVLDHIYSLCYASHEAQKHQGLISSTIRPAGMRGVRDRVKIRVK